MASTSFGIDVYSQPGMNGESHSHIARFVIAPAAGPRTGSTGGPGTAPGDGYLPRGGGMGGFRREDYDVDVQDSGGTTFRCNLHKTQVAFPR